MKKILLTIAGLLALLTADAKVVKFLLADGSMTVLTSSELSAIDFNDDGTMTVTTYDGQQIEALATDFEEIVIDDEETICTQVADTVRFKLDVGDVHFDLGTERALTKLNYVYPSQDPWGEPVTLSGTILIPDEIMFGEVASEGIILFNHYTKFSRNEAPTAETGVFEGLYLSNPLKPNYIIVESDFYGFGATVRFPQAFLQGSINARASLDGLLAARRLLEQMGIDYGPLCFNLGYSSGGFDALQTQRLRDMEYASEVSFDKTFAGGGPNDLREAYRQYVEIDSTAYNCVPLLLMVSTNEAKQLGLDYDDIFWPEISSRIDELVLSKNFASWPVRDSVGADKKIHEILMPEYCDLSSAASIQMQDIFAEYSLNNNSWTPDPSQRMFIFHSRGDDYVPIQSARPIVSFLKNKGFEPSIIPGRTNLQTNFVVRSMGHLSATVVFLVQSLAAIKAWPQMYTDNELNPTYAQIVGSNLNPVAIMRQLDAMGFDCRKMINDALAYISSMSGEGEGGSMDITTLISSALEQAGMDEQEFVEMAADSGVDVYQVLFQLLMYLYEQPADNGTDTPAGANTAAAHSAAMSSYARLLKAVDQPSTPVEAYQQQLRQWIESKK